MTVGSFVMLIAFCKTFGWVLTAEQFPQTISAFFLSNLPFQWQFLAYVILVCLIVGSFLTPAAATIILTPIIAPVTHSFTLNPVHVGARHPKALGVLRTQDRPASTLPPAAPKI
jgi:C4-dicarboxylate transporter DctM subunit